MKALLLLLALPILAAAETPTQTKRVYLGSVQKLRGIPVYHVVSQFRRVRAALTYHGHSEVLLYDAKWHLLASYNVGMPYALPTSLHDNILYFKPSSTADKAATHQQSLNPNAPPPAWLCVASNDCYNRLDP
jgi:hypothetical protein